VLELGARLEQLVEPSLQLAVRLCQARVLGLKLGNEGAIAELAGEVHGEQVEDHPIALVDRIEHLRQSARAADRQVAGTFVANVENADERLGEIEPFEQRLLRAPLLVGHDRLFIPTGRRPIEADGRIGSDSVSIHGEHRHAIVVELGHAQFDRAARELARIRRAHPRRQRHDLRQLCRRAAVAALQAQELTLRLQ
jgi:hypothetical protein